MSILVMSDIHGNLPALKAVLKDAATEYNEIWFLGDIVGYGPDPGRCLDLLNEYGARMVAGNHDWAVSGMIDVKNFNKQARAAIQLHKELLSVKQKKFLASLPVILKQNSVTLSHANPLEPIWGYVMDRMTAKSVLCSADTSLTLIGHSHITALWSLRSGLCTGNSNNCGKAIFLCRVSAPGQSWKCRPIPKWGPCCVLFTA